MVIAVNDTRPRLPAQVLADPALRGTAVALTPEEAAELLAGAPWRRIAMVGDSGAEGVREAAAGYPDLSWLDWVTAALAANAPESTCLNLARRGALAAEVRAEQLDVALGFEPDLVAVSLGGTDMMGRSFDPDAVEAELDTVVTALRATGATVLAVGRFDITRSGLVRGDDVGPLRERLSALAVRTAAVADRRGALFANLATHPASADPGIWGSDGVHLNDRGHAIAGSIAVRLLAGHLRWAATLRRRLPRVPGSGWCPEDLDLVWR